MNYLLNSEFLNYFRYSKSDYHKKPRSDLKEESEIMDELEKIMKDVLFGLASYQHHLAIPPSKEP